MQVTGTTTVNVEVDTTHNFTFTGTNTFTRDITIDSATFGTGNGLSTNIKIGRTALSAPTTATGIVAVGENAGRLVTTGQNDIYVGRNAAGNSNYSMDGYQTNKMSDKQEQLSAYSKIISYLTYVVMPVILGNVVYWSHSVITGKVADNLRVCT